MPYPLRPRPGRSLQTDPLPVEQIVQGGGSGVGHAVLLTSGTDTSLLSSYTTASITPTAGSLVRVDVENTKAGSTPETPTLSGNGGVSYTNIASQAYDTIASPTKRVTSFWGTAGTPGAITIDFGGVNQTRCSWSVYEFPGVDMANPIVLANVKQTAIDTGAPNISIALDPFLTLGNAGNAVTSINDAAAITQRASWYEIHDVAGATPAGELETQYILVDDDASSTWTGNNRAALIAMEIRASGSAVRAGRRALLGVGF